MKVKIPHDNVLLVSAVQFRFPHGFLKFLDPWNVRVAWLVVHIVYVYPRATRLGSDVYCEDVSRTVCYVGFGYIPANVRAYPRAEVSDQLRPC